MIRQNLLNKRIVALVLYIALMLPSSVQLSHFFDDHDHIICTEQKVHVHEANLECELCKFHVTTLKYDILKYQNFIVNSISTVDIENYISVYSHKYYLTNKRLRGPPYFS